MTNSYQLVQDFFHPQYGSLLVFTSEQWPMTGLEAEHKKPHVNYPLVNIQKAIENGHL